LRSFSQLESITARIAWHEAIFWQIVIDNDGPLELEVVEVASHDPFPDSLAPPLARGKRSASASQEDQSNDYSEKSVLGMRTAKGVHHHTPPYKWCFTKDLTLNCGLPVRITIAQSPQHRQNCSDYC
jgi:hypothetical protein